MVEIGVLHGFAYGVLGGALGELLGLFRMRKDLAAEFPVYLKSGWYWSITLLMILAGGVLVVVYLKSGMLLNPLLAVNVGASAPLILGSLGSQMPEFPIGRVS